MAISMINRHLKKKGKAEVDIFNDNKAEIDMLKHQEG